MDRLEGLDVSLIQDQYARECVVRLLNLLEDVMNDLRSAQAEVQRLRDENSRLKGEQGKPKIKGNTPKPPESGPGQPKDYSSEQERRTPKAWFKSKKKEALPVDRDHELKVDRAALPADAEFKGHVPVIVQDLIFRRDNVRFLKEKYYSPGENKTFLAEQPKAYEGDFGPGVKSMAITLSFGARVSEPKILELFHNAGIQISAGQLSNILIKGQDGFHAEKSEVYEAGLASSPWQQIDDTHTRVNGQNEYCQVIANPLYTAYETTESKDRQTILDVLRNGRPREYVLNDEAEKRLAGVLSGAAQRQLAALPRDERLDEATVLRLLDERLPKLGPQQRKWVTDAMAVAAYHTEPDFPVVRLFVCDDAPQFTWLTQDLMLCWVHEGRHYKKLQPWVPEHRQALADFLKQFWEYYHELQSYREHPTPEARERLSSRFDELFATRTSYWMLNDRIALTRAKKAALLAVLDHPEVPLHNNDCELGARERVRKRDVSFGPRTPEGADAWDTFATLAATTRKLGISFYAYVHDRVAKIDEIPRLASQITLRAKELNLGASWSATQPHPTLLR